MPDLSGARVLVTGAAGFVGARLVRALLARGARVDAVVRESTERLRAQGGALRVRTADVTDRAALLAAVRAAQPEIVFHLAMAPGHASSPREIEAALRTAIDGTANLLEAAAEVPLRRFVHFGSSLEYAPSPRPLREGDPLTPVSPRGSAKAAAARLVTAFASQRGLPATLLRVFSVYGPGEPEKRLVPTAIRCALTGAAMRLTAPGLRRDLVHVDDVCAAALAAALRDLPPGTCVNVGSGRQLANEEVVALVSRVAGRPVAILRGEHPASPCDSASRVADTALARTLLGWEAAIPFEEGVARTIAERKGAHAA